MPNSNNNLSVFLQSGNPDTEAVALTGPVSGPAAPGSFNNYAPGELGASFEINDKRYTKVILDSGATSATPVGAVAANQILFWKDKNNRIVTNDSRMAVNGQAAGTGPWCNSVAGIARLAVPTPGTLGTIICMLIRGTNIPVAASGSFAAAQTATANTAANTANVISVAVGTAPGYESLGVARGAVVSGNVNLDVDIPQLP